MLQTTNYQLSQWEPEDRILRTKFNADNAKIDAALAEIRDACMLERVMDIHMGESAQRVDLEVETLHLERYQCLQCFIRYPAETEAAHLLVRVNGIGDGYYTTGSNTFKSLVNLTLAKDICLVSTEIFVGRRLFVQRCSPTLTSETQFLSLSGHTNNIGTYDALLSGTQITIYGVRR